MSRLSRAEATGRVRGLLERHVHLIVRSRSGGDGFAIFGGHRPRHYFSRLYLETRHHRVFPRVHRADQANLCLDLLSKYGLVIFCGATTPPALAGHALQLPGMLDLVLPIPRDLSRAQWSRSALSDIRKVERGRFRCEIVSAERWGPQFVREYYLPSMVGRHGAEAILESKRGPLRGASEQGAELLRITRDGEWLGGCLAVSTADGYRLRKLGWLGGDRQLLSDGVVCAMYWGSIQRASELGLPRVLLGAASPTLEDGLLFFKGKWGAHFERPSARYGEYHLLLDPAHPSCRRFLRRHSLVTRSPDGRDIVVFSSRRPRELTVPVTLLAGIRRWYQWLDSPGATETDADIPAPLKRWVIEVSLSGGGCHLDAALADDASRGAQPRPS